MLLTRTDRHGITEYMALTFPPRSRTRLKLYSSTRSISRARGRCACQVSAMRAQKAVGEFFEIRGGMCMLIDGTLKEEHGELRMRGAAGDDAETSSERDLNLQARALRRSWPGLRCIRAHSSLHTTEPCHRSDHADRGRRAKRERKKRNDCE